MKINSLRELQKIVSFCRKQGVTSIEVDGIKLSLSSVEPKKVKSYLPDYSKDIPEASYSIPSLKPDVIETEELTPEQALFYSSVSEQQ